MKKLKLPLSYFNYISFLGTIIALIAWIAIIFLVIWARFIVNDKVYFELYTYLVVPGFLVLGLVLIPVGMYFKRRSMRKMTQEEAKEKYILNLNDPKTRNAAFIFVTVTVIFIICTIIGSYEGFHYTESNDFCGKLCHKVMDPEFEAYQNSPHAHVTCVECHVGEGVDWYVKSKMSGMRQVYKYMTNTYPRPIATPIENLRPARETCEKCHWPQKFYTNNIQRKKYYLADSANTEWDITLNMKIGASHESLGLIEGIHWHINPDVEIQYKANKKRDTIYWVKVIYKKTGKESVFTETESHISKDDLDKIPVRSMDCMDCHNRPSHEYRSPSYFVDNLFASGAIKQVPYLKEVAMLALKTRYESNESARNGITNDIVKYFKRDHPKVYAQFSKEISDATGEILKSYFLNTFPEMKVSYKEYPRNIGHFETNGCFRCHDNKHKATDNKTITRDCNQCHTILSQGKAGEVNYFGMDKTVDFIHPKDIGNLWMEMDCSKCHK
jgi:hypothetical protein